MRGIPSPPFIGSCKESRHALSIYLLFMHALFPFPYSKQQASFPDEVHLSISSSPLQKHHISPHTHPLHSTPPCCRLVYASASSLPATEELFNAIITALCGPSFRRENSFQGLQSIQRDNVKHLGPPSCSGNQ